MSYRVYREKGQSLVLIPKELLVAEIIAVRFINFWFGQMQFWLRLAKGK